MADQEVFDTGEPPKQRKKRKPMSASKKLEFKERMRLAREAKRAKAEGKEIPVKEEVVAPVKEKVIDTEPVVAEEVIEPVKPKRKVRHVPKQLDEHEAQLFSLKEEIANLKKGNTSKEDMEEIKQLKAELKEIRDIAKAYKKKQKELKSKPAPVKKEEVAPVVVAPPKPRYSTYKKSIWTKFT